MIQAPCKDCHNNNETCHSNCELYKAYRVKHEAEKARIKQARDKVNLYNAYVVERIEYKRRNHRYS